MKEIKFKAKDSITGDWRLGFINKSLNGYWYILSIEERFEGGEIKSKSIRYKVDPETICQYTGLKDAEGNEIYEGDIIKLKYIDPLGRLHDYYEEEQYVIKYKHGAFGFDTDIYFVPLLEQSSTIKGAYIPNAGNEHIILDDYNFKVNENIHD